MKEMLNGNCLEIYMKKEDLVCTLRNNGDVNSVFCRGEIIFGNKKFVVTVKDETWPIDYIGDPEDEPYNFTVNLWDDDHHFSTRVWFGMPIKTMDELEKISDVTDIEVKDLEYIMWTARFVMRALYEQI